MEIHAVQRSSGVTVIARTRLLGINDENLIFDSLQYRPNSDRIPVGATVEARFLLDGKRYGFVSRFLKDRVVFQLNKQQRLRGIALAKPASVSEEQRRNNFRVSLVGSKATPVSIVRAHDQISDACRIDGYVGTGQIVNLSASGMGLQVDRSVLPKAAEGELYYLTFDLEGLDNPDRKSVV